MGEAVLWGARATPPHSTRMWDGWRNQATAGIAQAVKKQAGGMANHLRAWLSFWRSGGGR